MSEVRQLKRKAAKRPVPRTVTVIGKGDFAEWECTARADFPVRLIEDLSSGDPTKIMKVFDAIIVDHNFPDINDEIAESMSDVDPWTGLAEMAGNVFEAIHKLPNR
jgi:hypothetical protein